MNAATCSRSKAGPDQTPRPSSRRTAAASGRRRSPTWTRAAARLARALVQHGLQPRPPVLVFHPMSAELYVTLLALFRLRLVAMFLDPSAGRDHMERCCACSRRRPDRRHEGSSAAPVRAGPAPDPGQVRHRLSRSRRGPLVSGAALGAPERGPRLRAGHPGTAHVHERQHRPAEGGRAQPPVSCWRSTGRWAPVSA